MGGDDSRDENGGGSGDDLGSDLAGGETVGERRTVEPPDTDDRFPVPLRGVAVDAKTRCTHYDSELDVVALRFPCCDAYCPCFRCHEAVADHDPERAPSEAFDDPAVLCRVCGATLSTRAYLDCGDACPECDASFNPGCRRHHDRYFEPEREVGSEPGSGSEPES